MDDNIIEMLIRNAEYIDRKTILALMGYWIDPYEWRVLTLGVNIERPNPIYPGMNFTPFKIILDKDYFFIPTT